VERFLSDFAAACRADLETLKAAGIPVVFWNLQNEPMANTTYSTCIYSPANYARTFLAVASVIRAYDPHIRILADTGPSWDFPYVRPVLDNPSTAALVDDLVIHHIGSNANVVHPPNERSGKPRFQNEYEYQPYQGPATPDKCLNTVDHIMNWFQVAQAPTWFWIHALKPYTNEEASGYSLGFWRPSASSGAPGYPAGLMPGHWTWNPYNWNAVGSFVRHLPWDSRSVAVDESAPDDDLRVLAFLRPDGKLTVVVSNRCSAPHTCHLRTGVAGATFKGFRYTPDEAGEDCGGLAAGERSGPSISTTLPDLSWEFWEQI
jgi:O-glycosyl hydrolase